jgi:hypothetical protein
MKQWLLALGLGLAILVGFCGPSFAAQNLLLEWADRPSSQEWMGSNPVFQRTLLCWGEGQRAICKLTVVTIGRDFCPVVLTTDAFRTDTNDLKVTRTANAVDLEFTDLSNTWTIHLKLTGGESPIVEQASGVVITRPILPKDRLRSSALVALVQGHEAFPGREFAEVALKCPKIAVVAAKRETK